MKHADNKDKTRLIILKKSQKVTLHELYYTLKISYNWLHIWGFMIVFLFKFCVRCAKMHAS